MIKIHILEKCKHCNGETYLPIGQAESYTGEKHTRYIPCVNCAGSGFQERWVSLEEFAELYAILIEVCTDPQALQNQWQDVAIGMTGLSVPIQENPGMVKH